MNRTTNGPTARHRARHRKFNRRRNFLLALTLIAFIYACALLLSEQRIMNYVRTTTLNPPSFDNCVIQTNKLTNPSITSTLKASIRTAAFPPKDLPSWVQTSCPSVYSHFTSVPYLTSYLPRFSPSFGKLSFSQNAPAPYLTSSLGAKSTCLLKLFIDICSEANIEVMIYAGAHLGAILHGGPIPWDDDIDVAIDYKHKSSFEKLCKNRANRNVEIFCYKGWNAWKISAGKNEDDKTHWKHEGYNSPYIDVFFVEVRFYWWNPFGSYVREVRPDGSTAEQNFKVEEFYPIEDYYYGGVHVKGPGRNVAKRYELERCFSGEYNHRFEAFFADAVEKEELEIDCCEMYQVGYPFMKEDGKVLSYKTKDSFGGRLERVNLNVRVVK